MKTCDDCGCRVYHLGCVNCNEAAYIAEQVQLTELLDGTRARCPLCLGTGWQAIRVGVEWLKWPCQRCIQEERK